MALCVCSPLFERLLHINPKDMWPNADVVHKQIRDREKARLDEASAAERRKSMAQLKITALLSSVAPVHVPVPVPQQKEGQDEDDDQESIEEDIAAAAAVPAPAPTPSGKSSGGKAGKDKDKEKGRESKSRGPAKRR